MGVVERSISTPKRILKLITNKQWNDTQKYLHLAIFFTIRPLIQQLAVVRQFLSTAMNMPT